MLFYCPDADQRHQPPCLPFSLVSRYIKRVTAILVVTCGLMILASWSVFAGEIKPVGCAYLYVLDGPPQALTGTYLDENGVLYSANTTAIGIVPNLEPGSIYDASGQCIGYVVWSSGSSGI